MDAETRPAGTPPVEVVRDGPLHELVCRQPTAVADVLANLDDPVLDTVGMVALLQRCATLAVSLFAPADHAGVTVDVGGRPYTASCTDQVTLAVDVHQYAADDGPCLQSARTGEVVRVDVATAREQWPEFTHDAEAAGVRSFLAAPLTAAGERVGALNLYSRSADGFAEAGSPEMTLLTLLTTRISRALDTYVRLNEAQSLVDQMTAAMESRAAIEQVKGILMAARGISAEEAFAVLREESQRSNSKLRTVAERFLGEVTGTGGNRPEPRA